MKRILLWLIVAAIVVTAFLLYRSWSRDQVNVAPDAKREIDKAKRR